MSNDREQLKRATMKHERIGLQLTQVRMKMRRLKDEEDRLKMAQHDAGANMRRLMHAITESEI